MSELGYQDATLAFGNCAVRACATRLGGSDIHGGFPINDCDYFHYHYSKVPQRGSPDFEKPPHGVIRGETVG